MRVPIVNSALPFVSERTPIAEYALIHPVPSGADAARRLSITAQSHVISVARVLEGSGRNFLNLFLNLGCRPDRVVEAV